MRTKLTFQTFSMSETFFKFTFIENEKEVGECSFVVTGSFIELTSFQIFEKYRGNGFSKKALILVNKIVEELAIDFNAYMFFLRVVPFGKKTLGFKKLVSLYTELLSVEEKYGEVGFLEKKLS